MKTRRFALLALLLTLALAFRLSLLLILVRGESMDPTLSSGSFLLTKRLFISRRPLARHEIVVARSGDDLIIKRIIAFPGEWVRMTNGVVFIDGVEVTEPFPVKRGSWTIKPGLVEPDRILLMGDNRELPLQAFYMIPKEAIIARTFH